MEPEGSSPYSQQPATGPYTEPDRANARPAPATFLRSRYPPTHT
jgi:hypothetical protein